MWRRSFCATFLMIVFAVSVVNAGSYGREELLDLAVKQNPRIAQAAAEWRASKGALRQARLYPNGALEIDQSDLRFGEDEGMTSAAVAQPLIFGGRRMKEIALAQVGVEKAQAELQLAIRETLAQVDRLHVRMLYHLADLGSQFELLDEAEATLAAAEGKSAKDSTRQFFKARIERDRIELEVTRHSAERVYTLQDLSIVLGGMTLQADEITGELSTDYATTGSNDHIVSKHPSFRVAQIAAEQGDARRAMLGREWIPDVTLRVGAGWREETDEAIPFAGLRIPLPLWNRNQGSIAESTSRTEALREATRAVELDLENEIRLNLQQLNEFDTFATQYRTSILPDAKQSLDETRARYSQGEDTHLDVLDSQRVYTEARATYYQYLLRFNELLAQRRALEGYSQEQTLERFETTPESGSPAARRNDR